MRPWIGKGFVCLLIALGLVLLLSALVEGPEESLAQGPRRFSVVESAAFLPGAPPAPQNESTGPLKIQLFREAALALLFVLALLPTFHIRCRDANGRVVRTKRYVGSVYQVFRPEAAGG